MRGACALLVVGIGFLAADVVERIVIAPLVRLRPSCRSSVLPGWARLVATWVLATLVRVGGSRLDLRARVPARAGILVLMNHQSLIDIPVAFKSLERGIPRVVTHRRYGRGIPLVSHMLRLYEHPLVEPGRTTRAEAHAIAERAAGSPGPLLVFPEGHRTRDGAIRPFKKSLLNAVLAARSWEVWIIVVDGLTPCARWKDFVRNVSRLRAQAVSEGPFYPPAPGENPREFLEELRQRMSRRLEELRADG